MKDVRAFLKKIRFVQTWEEMAPIEAAFLRHMEDGLAGRGGSLPMIPTYLTADTLPDEEQTLIVLDAGGTNLRTALLRVVPGKKPETLYVHKRPMPGKDEPLTRAAFFRAIAEEVAPIADKSDRIGFCFSFPCVIRPDLDGEILYLDKEITVHEIEGALVGEGLKAALAEMGAAHDQRVVILNDTVAALLGVLAEHPAACFSGYIGMILGTGMNCCYSEKNSRILKNEGLRGLPGHSIINMEAGNFNDMPITEPDVLLSKGAKVAGQNLSEKMMSGAYQGKLMHALLSCAAEEGLFSEAFSARLAALPREIEAKDISLYTEMPARAGLLHDLAPEGEDAAVMYQLADALLERAAKLAVCMLTAIMSAAEAGTDPLKPVAIAIEGSTYAGNEALRMKIRSELLEYTAKQRGHYCRVFSTEDANMVGSAMAAMSI